jgi:hypothetical protein
VPASRRFYGGAGKRGKAMTQQQLLDDIKFSLPSSVPIRLRERILDAIWEVILDHFDPEEETEDAPHRSS